MYKTLYDLPVTTIDGLETTLDAYRGQILLIVNVASQCGFTSQYAHLEALHQDYAARGVCVLGFPCNQFLHQEPGSCAAIKMFAESTYHVTFPLFAKIHVKNPQQSVLYAYLEKKMIKKPLIFMPWNFTKILVNQQGEVLRQYAPTASFARIRSMIESMLTS